MNESIGGFCLTIGKFPFFHLYIIFMLGQSKEESTQESAEINKLQVVCKFKFNSVCKKMTTYI